MTEGFDFTHSQDFAALAASFGMADDGGAAAAMAYGAMAGGGGGGNRFNPMGGGSQKAGMNSKGLPLNPGQQPCSFYMKRGECKFGDTCRFDHPESGPGGAMPGTTVNSAGYPLNEGQTDCGFYMKTGACKFGATCRFNHPEGVATSHASQQTGPFPAKGGQGGMGMMAGMGMGGGMGEGKGGGKGKSPPPSAVDGQTGLPLRAYTKACDFYLRAGQCQYGLDCKWNHPSGITPGMNRALLNQAGYPINYGQQDCGFYLQNGICKFGATCRNAHPEMMMEGMAAAMGGGGMMASSGDHPSRPGEAPCTFFMKTGNCKFGATCRFDHPAGAGGSGGGFQGGGGAPPSRPGEPPCAFFLKTGNCKFGATCRFDHPAGQAAPAAAPAGFAADGTPVNSFGLPIRAGGIPCEDYITTGLCVSALDCPFDHPEPGLPQAQQGGGQYQADGAPLNSAGLPMREGQQPCMFYLKTGQCKFAATCRFDHPEDRQAAGVASGAIGPMNSLGFPSRPGANPCTFYLRTGECKFGATCKNDHPEPGSPEAAAAQAQVAMQQAANGKGGGGGGMMGMMGMMGGGAPEPKLPARFS